MIKGVEMSGVYDTDGEKLLAIRFYNNYGVDVVIYYDLYPAIVYTLANTLNNSKFINLGDINENN